MPILVDENTAVIVQGITGNSGRRLTRHMVDYGTRVIGGVTPGRGGEEVNGLPVYNTVEEMLEIHPDANATLISVPAQLAKEAAIEALHGGLKTLVLRPERVPHQDMMEIVNIAKKKGSVVIGANSIGLVSPGKALIGSLGGTPEFARQVFNPGPCGVISRSGGQTTTVCYYLTSKGLGQSTVIGIGGDMILGSDLLEVVSLFDKDEATKAICIFGEVGSSMEEALALEVGKGTVCKPVVMYIAGKFTKKDMRFGHAGAILTGNEPTVEEKMEKIRKAGVYVCDHLGDMPNIVSELI